MTKFIDGPAAGKVLMLKRTPILLRVVQSGDKFDALDQLDDKPEPGEKIYCYVMSKYLGNCHIHAAGGRGGWYPSAEYKLRKTQPSDQEMRLNESWSKWCHAQPEHSECYRDNLLDRSA